MGNSISSYITIAALSGVLNLILFFFASLKKSNFSGIRYYALNAIASAIYAWGFAFELASRSLDEIKFWVAVEYLGMPFAPPLCLLIAMHYVGMERRLRGAWKLLMFVIPAISFLLVATNDYHHLFYQSIYLREGAPTPMADIKMGEWYIVHGSYTFGCLFAAVLLLARHWTKTKGAYHLQLGILIASMLVPIVAAFVYLMGLTPNGMDPVPVLTCLTTALSAWAIFTNRMLTVVPVARDTIFESMRDGVLVLDSDGRLVDYNHAAAAMIPSLGYPDVGRSIDEIWREKSGSSFPLCLAGDRDEREFADEQTRQHEHGGQASQGMQGAQDRQDVQGRQSALDEQAALADQVEQQIEWPGKDGVFYYRIHSAAVRKPNEARPGRIVTLIDVTEQRRLQQNLQLLAYYDGLTRIYNRTRFLHLSKEQLERSAAAGEPLSILLFDIDYFKQINDTYGHDVGDEALRHVVSICSRALGPDALFGRYGGEEFVLCLPSAGMEAAAACAEQLRRDIADSPLSMPDGDIRITASFGVAEVSEAANSIQALLREADKALYRSKEGGRNTVRLAGA
ncbi:histidine kinase N-terminal 7TM domain-containing protein [Cohnella lubricantis]|uniref:Diguanylate cyclase n=1 Tax=Cohnella lubricantis TaxID=2163172 RepID=A0A841TBW9_9BACL|nr:histidine kinase N-terminal 7TM domain-containing protein [Cohnella lubricantis]MBB6676730.1 diguanylate cyclase [Cohnella lubricantis]MBP2117776.1 diguanylate cyclase (GGDEF)-like protein [Cohnella lubricantis]